MARKCLAPVVHGSSLLLAALLASAFLPQLTSPGRCVMKTKRQKSGSALALLVSVLAGGIGNSAIAQDAVWRVAPPPGALSTCSPMAPLCFDLTHMKVRNTPNDAGSQEEWTVKFTASAGNLSKSKYVEVKDSYAGTGLTYNLGLRFCVSDHQGGTFELRVTGYEEDMWPNPDDPIPKLRIIVVNPCSTGGEPNLNVTDVGSSISRCKKSDGGDREACYYINGQLQ